MSDIFAWTGGRFRVRQHTDVASQESAGSLGPTWWI